jgi:hypothetical protein
MNNRGVWCVLAVLTFLLGEIAQAQSVPQLINYQGRLNDSAGLPVNNLSVPMVFGVWDAATVGAGSQLWTEAQSVQVSNGLYSVRLGAVTPVPAAVFAAPARYLQVSVFGETLSPRAQLTSVPFAVAADLLDGQHATSFANATHGHAFSEITGSATDAQIPDNITITNADKVDNLDASAFALAAHNHSGANITSGTIGNAYFSAYSDLGTDGYLNNDAGTDLLMRTQSDSRYAPLTHAHSGSDITSGTIGYTYFSAYGDLSTDGYLDGNSSTDVLLRSQADARFAASSHNHSGANITSGTIGNAFFSAYSDLTADGYLDGNSSTDVLLRSQGDTRFINTTGDDSMSGSLTVGGDLTVSGNNIGLNIAPTANYGISNNSTGAPQYGLYMYGTSYAFRGMNTIDPTTHYAYLASQDTGIFAATGTPFEFGNQYGGRFTATTQDNAFGAYSRAYGSGTGMAEGVYGYADNTGSGNAYGGYFTTSANGTGIHYALWAAADDYAAWLQDGRVHIGAAGTENFVTGNGDLYVQNALEVDGVAHFTGGIDAPGSIDSADVSFNYAGSASKGGAASDLSCTNCVAATEVQFNYAGSSSEGGTANDAKLLDGHDSTYYQNATYINAGTLSTNYYSAYNDLATESYLNNDAGTDLLTRAQSDVRFSPLTHTHTGADINSGTIGTNYYSAYSDLGAEGYLDNNSTADLITQFQGDGRFLNNDRDDATTGSLGVGGDLEVTGGNIGLGQSVNTSYGIINDPSTAPSYGALFYGTSGGIYGRLASDPNDHYGYLGSLSYGAYARTGNSDEVSTRYGGYFVGYSQASAYGSYGLGYSYGAGVAYGAKGYAYGDSTGAAYGGYFTVGGTGSGAKYAGYFGGGRVKIGDAGTQNYVTGDGDLFVEDQLEVGGAINYSAAKTRMYSVPMVGEGWAARPMGGGDGHVFGFQSSLNGDFSGLVCHAEEDYCYHRFAVHLPDNAVIVSFWFWGWAVGGSGHNLVCTLYRGDHLADGVEMASVASTAVTTMYLSDTTIQNATIDNGNYNYYIYCAETAANDTTVVLSAMRINYTVDGPD